MKFIDEVTIFVKGGDGGNGCISFRREPYVPKGGPNGGDGGDGGDVIIVTDDQLTTLLDLKYHTYNIAKNGEHGRGKDQYGKKGDNLIIKVPLGTVIKEKDSNIILKDLISLNDTYVAAKGGKGGRGNIHFVTPSNRAPYFAEKGKKGEERWLKLELKLIADVGIIGFPSVGKSTFISVVSACKPKIADYPFTTLIPNLGVVKYGDYQSFVIADLPGLIKGASEGAGLGIRFLKHAERTKLFIHMIDISNDKRDPINDFNTINYELESYNPELIKKPQIVALNKIDILENREKIKEISQRFKEIGVKVYPLSAITKEGIREILNEVIEKLSNISK